MQKLGETARGLGERAKDLGGKAKDVTKRSGELLEVARLKFDLNKLEKEMDNNLQALGELVFRRDKGEEDLDGEIDRLLQGTRKLDGEVKSLNEQIKKLQPKPLVCPQCKLELPAGGRFCSYCGKLVTEEKEEHNA
ncbi:zinc ribbon domain-containing protein [Desulfotomaculum copahuensis]|uniref:Zinc ribbon domain-containing protein n=1 Tax=Desulfotomaculum copahuensis TaxID=1838280 RepID=A0A1B7LHE7_9FIRM|nr:zinc ribbon domain-containing protein [Desulfotomaculum copahuensis]OAT85623.1 hypothetical protein A6M21_05700 [Desulfotomaculum copahuensis]